MVMHALALILVFIAMVYGLLVLWQWVGWRNLVNSQVDGLDKWQPYTVVIAARNEQGRVGQVIADLLAQTHKPEAIIVVDDHSTDATLAEVLGLARQYPGVISLRLAEGQGKKAALALGIAHASTEIILCTDADCRVGSNWAIKMIEFQSKNNFDMVLGPVILWGEDGVFATIQRLEMNAIMGVTGGMVAHGHPIMANGANLLIRKPIFDKVGGHGGQPNNPSGDDVFLMLNINKNRSGSVGFCPHFEAVVATEAKAELADFIEQRKRWLSKKSGYTDAWVVGVALITYLGNLAALAALILLPFLPEVAGWALFCKFIPDLILVRNVQKQLQPQCGLGWVALAEVFIIFYVSLIGLVPSGRYVWKNRMVNINP